MKIHNYQKIFLALIILLASTSILANEKPKLAYIVSDSRIPFWEIMSRGIKSKATELGYQIDVYSANNDAKTELQLAVKALAGKVAGLIISPTNSSASVTILKLAENAGVPVVISDIGTESGLYVSYISSDNREGAYQIGQVLVDKMKQLGWTDGTVGIIAIPQKRANGQARTAGFMQAMEEAGIRAADIRQQETFSYEETYEFSKELIAQNPGLRAIWLQGSDRYQGALDAIADAGKKDDILLICFDAEPEFIELISNGTLVGAAMQQPFLMGEMAVKSMHEHLSGITVTKEQQLNILAISSQNLDEKISIIKRNVLGIETP